MTRLRVGGLLVSKRLLSLLIGSCIALYSVVCLLFVHWLFVGCSLVGCCLLVCIVVFSVCCLLFLF